MDKSFTLKARVASYWRYDKQCPFVALEASTRLVAWNSGGQSDILILDKKKTLIETEIKVSSTDLRKDREKEKHYHLYLDYFRDDSLLPDVKGWRRHRRWLIDKLRWDNTEYSYPVSMFYFAVPQDLQIEALSICTELYPYAGLLVVEKTILDEPWTYAYNPISIAKEPYHFIKNGLDEAQILHMQREMSATICRLAYKVDKLNV